MKYSFKVLEEEFKKIGFDLNKEKMKELELIDVEDNITQTGILLSDNCNHNIKVITYSATDIEDKTFNGSILSQFYKIRDYLIKSELNRFYPLEMILEGLINAIVHRDYDYKGDTIFRIFKDKIEIISLGGLIGNLTIEGIKLGICEPRNISLKKYEIIPEIISVGGVFKIAFPKIEYLIYGKNLKKQYRKILDLFNTYSEITNIMIQNHLGVKSTSAIIYLKEMQELGLIKKVKNGRNIKYIKSDLIL